jgi:hypothetical protein
MDKRRSFYLASRQDDFGEPPVDKGWVADIPYVMPANDDVRTKERLSASVAFLLRRLIALHRLNSPIR